MVDAVVKNTSTVVVALPSEDERIHRVGPEQKHATLLWFGEVDDFTAGWINAQILKLIYESKITPLAQTVEGVKTLGEDEAWVVSLVKHRGGGLDWIREQLLQSDQVHAAWSAVKQFPEYQPHVTLGYGDEVSEQDRAEADAMSEIKFDRLALWHKDKQIAYPLDELHIRSLTAGARIVRTQEGSKRFGVPIGSEITTDSKGRVISVKTSGRGALTPKSSRPDPNRTPTKFVPTRPGQKAKLPGGVR